MNKLGYYNICNFFFQGSSSSEVQWCFSQVKGTLDDDVTEADIISCVEFNQDGDLLATGDKGGRVVIFQRDPQVGATTIAQHIRINFD